MELIIWGRETGNTHTTEPMGSKSANRETISDNEQELQGMGRATGTEGGGPSCRNEAREVYFPLKGSGQRALNGEGTWCKKQIV